MDIDVRTINDDEVPAWCGALNTGFLNPNGAVDAEARRPGLFLERTWAGLDGDQIVATLRSFPAELTVPGGRTVDTSAVTSVATVATHRRRGLASRMVLAELAASAERGEPASILIAAEWGIYGRFGYGAATEHQAVTVDAGAARFREPPAGTVEYIDLDTARAVAPIVFERHRAQRPGEISRSERYWDIDLGILRYPSRKAPNPGFHVVALDPDGEPVGVARYEYEERWEGRRPQGKIAARLLVADRPAGEALLWHHLISHDWTTEVRADDRPTSEVLPWLLVDPRTVRASDRSDFLWLRPLDVPALLGAREYPVPGRLVLEVRDATGLAAGRFKLDGAECTRTTESADLTLDVAALASVYLGGHGLRLLAAAGLVDEHSPGAVARADAMFRTPDVPWCSTWF